jgi:hypothetical protein
LFAADQLADEHGSVMAYRTTDALDREILSDHFWYYLAREEILDDVRPFGLPMWNAGLPKRLVTKLDQATLDLPVPVETIPVREMSDLVQHLVGLIKAHARCGPSLMTFRRAPPV